MYNKLILPGRVESWVALEIWCIMVVNFPNCFCWYAMTELISTLVILDLWTLLMEDPYFEQLSWDENFFELPCVKNNFPACSFSSKADIVLSLTILLNSLLRSMSWTPSANIYLTVSSIWGINLFSTLQMVIPYLEY